jgi:hypothetical protein
MPSRVPALRRLGEALWVSETVRQQGQTITYETQRNDMNKVFEVYEVDTNKTCHAWRKAGAAHMYLTG